MPTNAFTDGFHHEIQNRAFALRAIGRLAGRLDGDPRQRLWAAYLKLEVFNAPIYQAAATRWGMDASPRLATRVKAWVVSSVPKCLLKPFLKYVYMQTVAYCDVLHRLRDIGPSEARTFLDYMVDQEEFQIDMMKRSLNGEDAVLASRIDAFIHRHEKIAMDNEFNHRHHQA
ncbi:TPA: hypothetical protein QDC20_003715 [Burkholderia aenigmatica]|uniref:hypothetical protein n=1 Tax=Burkholderia sp. AU45251 TaxID=3059204 RepID=UPI00265049E7|nr:hypothetical protein [Burkholderia sp. AU45251]HDR9481370.1 hypothetical protein [Burkholderia aenigmatica]MDN7514007.1 hypothetical protein [Burkholderia sp. AU45251]HDR9512897.1 hypothetical protein [Burkholderia aenigmatica]HDR9592804.1 hypothetical protein [Burkholderia aenigmatica]HDR9598254.1 hypothetical protein [Burkholderia aenigmatica]